MEGHIPRIRRCAVTALRATAQLYPHEVERRDAAAEMTRLIMRVQAIATDEPGTAAIEPTLIELVDLLQGEREHRDILVNKMLGFVQRGKSNEYRVLFGPGQREVVEYTMHLLRWPEVARCLETMRDSHPDVSTRRMASACLLAYEDNWDGRDLYASLA
jgi:hypothetical protein